MKKFIARILSSRRITEAALHQIIRVHNFLYKLISLLAVNLEGGLHPKHRITNYHDFFIHHIPAGAAVLDLGCGNGALAHDVLKKARSILAIDISSENIDKARSLYHDERLTFLRSDVTQLFLKTRFDAIILSNILEHIENRIVFLRSLHHCSSRILLRVPLITRDWLVVYTKELGLDYRSDSTHFVEYTIEGLHKELERGGWILSQYEINWGELWGVCIPIPPSLC